MPAYTPEQWLLLFFFYCLCGWLWESCYVSARQHRWVNRGFLHGPLLPIYGTGAIVILYTTLPVRDSLPLLFLLGMASATILELVTGAAMERLFQVRYWDYTGKPCNLDGYICLSSSLAWGGFSVLLVWVIHPPVEWLLLRLPPAWASPLAWSLAAFFSVDVFQSMRAALNLRQVLTALTEENETLGRLARRAEELSALAGEELESFRARTQAERLLLTQRLEAARTQRAQTRRETREELLRAAAAARAKALDNVAEVLKTLRLEEHASGETLETLRLECSEGLRRLQDQKDRIRRHSAETYHRALRILRANPSASARHHAEAMAALRRMNRRPEEEEDQAPKD